MPRERRRRRTWTAAEEEQLIELECDDVDDRVEAFLLCDKLTRTLDN
jgi:hypothetical protein